LASVQVFAPAKINLFLGVGAVRADGYHEVVTVMHALELGDTVRVSSGDRLKVTTRPDLGLAEEDNLAWRAARKSTEVLGIDGEVHIHIDKRIPQGAGLGGGSSDAAAVIAALCLLYGIDVDGPEVRAVASSLGADVPFFLTGPAALMEGRGDVLVRTLPPVHVPIALLKPAGAVRTRDAYGEFDRHPVPAGDPAAVIASLERGDLDAKAVANNLALAAGELVPESREALALASSSGGVLAATVSGSGSAVFAVCSDAGSAARVALAARAQGMWAEATWTAREGVRVARAEDDR
jgi:4-diphosphocytidyl-2-C-methyl-D-erythritol kinase